jgi:acetyl-CoA carboxylase biotin carboxylase subunit
METPAFQSGKYNTHFIEDNKDFLFASHDCDGLCEDMVLIAAYLEHSTKLQKIETNGREQKPASRWRDTQRHAYI